MHSDTVCNALDAFHGYLARNADYCRNHAAAQVSDFWKAHFSARLNFPDAGQFMTFRTADFLYGIGETRKSSLEQKRREFERTLKSIELFVPRQFLERLREPVFGAPVVFRSEKICQSAGFLLNAGTTYRLDRLIDALAFPKRPLHVAEIGAGWGASACQLHQIRDIASYTIIDLPENLCLSSVYLTATLSARKPAFVECAPGLRAAPAQDHLFFALPPAIDNLAGPYDVVLNTFSFQEMDKETVLEYLNFTVKCLSSDGILISFNAHDKAGIRRPSEYLIPGLRLIHMRPFRSVPAGFFNTIPYEMVFRKTDHRADEAEAIAVDAIGEMIQLGLDGDLEEPIRQAVGGTSDAALHARFRIIRDFFYESGERERERLGQMLLTDHRSAPTLFLLGNYWFARGDFGKAAALIEESLGAGLRDFAAVRATVLLALSREAQGHGTRMDTATRERLASASAGLFDEIIGILERKDIRAVQYHIARVLECPPPPASPIAGLVQRIKRRQTRQGSATP